MWKPKKAPPVNLSVATTTRLLRTCPIRRRQDHEYEIYYRKRWRLVGRTDLMDDVRTSRRMIPRVVFGARITRDAFFVIDCGTDG